MANGQPVAAALAMPSGAGLRSASRRCCGSADGIALTSACVYGCCGRSATSPRGPALDDRAGVQHDDVVADPPHDVEVVRDEQVADAELGLQRSSRLRICAWTDTSSAEVGSSQTTRSGPVASARAMPSRCRWPPESSVGYVSRRDALQPDRANSSSTRAAPPSRHRPCARSGSATTSRTLKRASSESYGSWNTIDTALRIGRRPRDVRG